MGRIKIGTSLDKQLVQRAQEYARTRGTRLNDLLELALQGYLDQHQSGLDYVRESFGSYQVTPEHLRAAMGEDPFDT